MSDDKAQQLLDQAAQDFAAQRYDKAAAGFQEVIKLHPDVAELHINLGAALRGAGDYEAAEQAYRAAITLAPENALAWFNLANLLSIIGRRQEALTALQKADVLQPGTPEILNNLGVALYDIGNIDDALKHYDAALAGRPGFTDALTNRGNALQRLCRMDEAQTALEAALEAEPDNPVFHLNMSAFMAANGNHVDAINWARQAIEIDPSYTDAKLKLASLLIQQGDLPAGFSAYEARWEKPGWHNFPDRISAPMWDGSDLTGKHVLVWNEQGYGDALLYARYLPKLVERGAVVNFMCEAPLLRLMQMSFGDAVRCIALDETPPAIDFHVSIMSLPYLLGTSMDNIPDKTPYLQAVPDDVSKWQREIQQHAGDRPTVGLIWAGNPGQAHDYSRSMAAENLAPILENENFCFFNLLIGPRGDMAQEEHMIDLRPEINDFADTAALMSELDLVISVDSGPAHLAGACGYETWIMLCYDPDSRYFLNSGASPWYPTARLFRQPSPGDWPSVTKDVTSALDEYLRTKAKS